MWQALKGLSCLIVVSSFCNKIGPHAFRACCVRLIKLIRAKRIMWPVGVIVRKTDMNGSSSQSIIIDQSHLIFCSSFVCIEVVVQAVGNYGYRIHFFVAIWNSQECILLHPMYNCTSCQWVITVLVDLSALLRASSMKGGRWDEPSNGPVSMLKKEALGAWEKRYRSVRWENLHGNSKRKMGGWRKGWQRGSRQLGFKGEQACYWVVAAWYVILWLVALSSHSGCHWVP